MVGAHCAGGSGFRHTISNAAAMANLTTEMHLSELPLHASRLVHEHRSCHIVLAINAKSNLLRGKKIGLARRKIAFVAVYDPVPVVQRLSAGWHSRIDV
jgi:RNA:NAD 2'-phosphotransferase (TPT1/KptA family)